MKRKGENALKSVADNYRKLISDRLEHEFGIVDETKITGNAVGPSSTGC